MRNRSWLGNILLILAAMIWGAAFVAQRAGMDNIGPITFLASRSWLAAAAVTPAALWHDRSVRRSHPDWSQEKKDGYRKATILGGLGCGVFLTAASAFQQMGLLYTTAGKAGFITAMYMLLVPVIHFVLFRKKNPLQVWLAVIIGVFGLYLLCMTEGLTLTKGDALEAVCALLFSFHILCCDHFAPKGNTLAISAIQFAVASVLATILAFLTEKPSWEGILSAAVPLLYCGLLSGGVAHTLQVVAQKYTQPAIASLLMSLESVFAVLSGALLLGERMSAREAAGCAVMFAAILLAQTGN